MLIHGRRLWDRLRQPRSRADEIADVRRRLAAQAPRRRATAREVELADAMRRLRGAVFQALGTVRCCADCGRGGPPPNGRWDGGYCCGGHTEDIFTDEELGALRLSGTRPGHLRPPDADHAGCAFRGPAGCSLAPVHRANRCLRYLCTDLVRELYERGDLPAIEALCTELHELYQDYVAARAARLDDEALGLRPGAGRDGAAVTRAR